MAAPAWNLHPMKGSKMGHWSVTVSGNWRMVFTFEGTDAVLVDDLDYHWHIDMSNMHNPPHPGEVLREYLGDMTVTDAALQLGVNRVTLTRILSGHAGISADRAYRLASAFGTSPELWAGMQMQYDLDQAAKSKRPHIARFNIPSPLGAQGFFCT